MNYHIRILQISHNGILLDKAMTTKNEDERITGSISLGNLRPFRAPKLEFPSLDDSHP